MVLKRSSIKESEQGRVRVMGREVTSGLVSVR